MIKDISLSLQNWPFWTSYTVAKMNSRYKHSMLGSSWMLLSFFIFCAGMAFMHTVFFGSSFEESFMYVSVGFLVWNLCSSIVLQSPSNFLEFRQFIVNSDFNLMHAIFSLMLRNFILFAIQAIVVACAVGIYIYRGNDVVYGNFAFLPVVLLAVFFIGFQLSLTFSILGIVLPDTNDIVASLVRFLFFLSPVIWPQEGFASGPLYYLSLINPFAIAVDAARFSIGVGDAIPSQAIMSMLVVTLAILAFNAAIYNRSKRMIPGWM